MIAIRGAALALALAAALPANAAGPTARHLFVSPMGEPFRGDTGGAPPDRWFAGADKDGNGALSRQEFAADAQRFFAQLDRGHDGEIDPDDVEWYESTLLPEMRMRPEARSGGGDDLNKELEREARVDYSRQGAARFGYLDLPEPVTPADTNFNRGVDLREFIAAADARFRLLDRNGDGVIARDELPRFAPVNGLAGAGEDTPPAP